MKDEVSPSEILEFIKNNYNYYYDEFDCRYKIDGVAIHDYGCDGDMINRLVRRVRNCLDPSIYGKKLLRSIGVSDCEKNRLGVPVRNSGLEMCTKYKHKPRDPGIIDRVANLFPVKDPRSRAFIKKWLLSLPDTVLNGNGPYVLTLVGNLDSYLDISYNFRRWAKKHLDPFFITGLCGGISLFSWAMFNRLLVDVGNMSYKVDCEGKLDGLQGFMKERYLPDDLCDVKGFGGKFGAMAQRRALVFATANDKGFLQNIDHRWVLCVELNECTYKEQDAIWKAFGAIDKGALVNEMWIQGKDFKACELTTGEKAFQKEVNEGKDDRGIQSPSESDGPD